jgi:hypothetical protein
MARIAYTERFRSSLMALISIFLRPMVCEYGQTGGHGRVIRGVGGGRWVWLESAEDKGKCSRAATGKKERRDDGFQAGAAGGQRAGSCGLRAARYMSAWLRDTLDGGARRTT